MDHWKHKHNASIIGKCKISINCNIKYLWEIVVHDWYTLIEQSTYDIPDTFHYYTPIKQSLTKLSVMCVDGVVNCLCKIVYKYYNSLTTVLFLSIILSTIGEF